jgi:hypothetical protein
VAKKSVRSTPRLSPSRTIELEPADWFVARWKPWSPLPRPKPAAFDEATCRDRARAFSKWGQEEYYDHEPFKELKIPKSMTVEEADFWFRLTAHINENTSPAQALGKMQRSDSPRMLTAPEAKGLAGKWTRYRRQAVHMLSFLMTPAALLDLLVAGTKGPAARWAALAYRDFVLVHLPQAELEGLRDSLALRIVPGIASGPLRRNPADSDPADRFPAEVIFGATLGCHDEIARVMAELPPESFRLGPSNSVYFPMEVAFGLAGPEAIVAAQRRLGFGIEFIHHFRQWLAATELLALDVIRDGIRAYHNTKWHRDQGLKALVCVKAPEVAGIMLELSLEPKYASIPKEWLEFEVGNAVAGLVPIAAGTGPLAAAAGNYLREQRQRGYGDVVDLALADVRPEVAAAIRR